MSKAQIPNYDVFTRDSGAAVKDSMDALMRSGKIFAERYQDMMSTCMSMCQDCTEKQASAVKSMMTCKTLNEATEAQNKLAQQSFDDMMSAMTRLTEMSIRMANECMEPINDQISRSVKKASESLAA